MKVLYVLSNGHSSSTLVNLIVGTSKNCFSVGELKSYHFFSSKIYFNSIMRKANPYLLCDCNNNFENCNFWFPITQKIISKKLFPRKLHIKQRINLFIYLFFKLPRIHQKKSEDEKLFREILIQAKHVKQKNIKYIVDSSKDLNRLIYLSQNKNIEVQVIHLIRDGRAVINSHEKQGHLCGKILFQWVSLNFFSKIFLRFHKIKHYNLSYDKFAQNPDYYIKELNKKFNLKINPKTYLEDIQKEEWHNFAGNSARWSKFTEIKYDQSWKKRMPKWKQWILTILCYVPNKLWVYNKR